MNKICELERMGDNATKTLADIFDELFICNRKASHSIVVKGRKMSSPRTKKVFRLCDEHFRKFEEHYSESSLGCDCEVHRNVKLRRNRL